MHEEKGRWINPTPRHQQAETQPPPASPRYRALPGGSPSRSITSPARPVAFPLLLRAPGRRRHRVMPASSEGMAAQDPAQGQPSAAKQAMTLQRDPGILRTGRRKPASGSRPRNRVQQRRDHQLVATHQHPRQPDRHAADAPPHRSLTPCRHLEIPFPPPLSNRPRPRPARAHSHPARTPTAAPPQGTAARAPHSWRPPPAVGPRREYPHRPGTAPGACGKSPATCASPDCAPRPSPPVATPPPQTAASPGADPLLPDGASQKTRKPPRNGGGLPGAWPRNPPDD